MEIAYAPKDGPYAGRIFKINYVPVGNGTADLVDSITKGTEFRQTGRCLFTNIAEVVKAGKEHTLRPIDPGEKTFLDIFELAVAQRQGVILSDDDPTEAAIAYLFS